MSDDGVAASPCSKNAEVAEAGVHGGISGVGDGAAQRQPKHLRRRQ